MVRLYTLDDDMEVAVRTDNVNEEVDELEGDTQPNEGEAADVDDVNNLLTARESSPGHAQTREPEPAQPDIQYPSNHPMGSDDDDPDDPSSMLSQVRATTPSIIPRKVVLSIPKSSKPTHQALT
jgi:hypothetical protein